MQFSPFLLPRLKGELYLNKPNFIQTSAKEQFMDGMNIGKRTRIGDPINQHEMQITEY
jgi:hypothetical protein